MMGELFFSVFEVSVVTGVTAGVLMLVLPFLNRRYAAKWSYYIWIFLAVRLLLPVSGQTVLESAGRMAKLFSQEQRTPAVTEAVNHPQRVVIEIPPQMTTPITVQKEHKAFTALDVAAFVWMVGCVLALAFPMCSYVVYRKRMQSRIKPLEGAKVHESLQEISKEFHIKRRLPVMEYDGNISPMMIGIFHPVLVLPKRQYSGEELYFILRHELVHLKRHDVSVKLLLVAVGAMHWFNPLVHLMKRRAVVDMEISCDERVIRGIAYADRKAYTETLFSMIQSACGKRTYLSTQFYGGKEVMKKRFRNIFTRGRKKNGLALFLCAAALTVAAGTLVSCGISDTGAGGEFGAVMFQSGAGSEKSEKKDAMSDETLCELAKQYFAAHHGGMMPQFAEVDSETDEGLVLIHLYDISKDDSVTMTLDWYTVSRETGIGEDVNFEPVNLLEESTQTNEPADLQETGAQADDPAGDVRYAQMAGAWQIDFARTENLWGSGISYGNEMVIEADGSFSYYIGIGTGGTGQCEIDGDMLRVEVKPYEDHMEGKEILTLRYVDEDGSGLILMDWYGSDVYWKRTGQTSVPETKVLTFQKEGQEEQKEAKLTAGDGFAFYLPVGEWQLTGPDLWTSTLHAQVQLWVAHFKDASIDDANKQLAENGYSFEDGQMLQENGTVVLKVKLFEAEGDVWSVFFRYPTEAEEGWGRELAIIADTFVVMAKADSAQPSAEENEDSEEIYRIVEQFADAYFGGSAKDLETYLADSYTGDIETYEGPGTAEVMAVRGLGTDTGLAVGSTKEISLEFRDSTEDSYTYLSFTFIKQTDGWKVQSYGLEK